MSAELKALTVNLKTLSQTIESPIVEAADRIDFERKARWPKRQK